MPKKSRTPKQLASDQKRSRAMKGTRPKFLKSKGKRRSSVTKKKTSHKSKETTIPLSILLPVLFPLIQAATFDPSTGRNGIAFDRTTEGAKQTLRSLMKSYSGVDLDTNEMDWMALVRTYGSLALGVGVHKYVAPSANRVLARNNIPLLRV